VDIAELDHAVIVQLRRGISACIKASGKHCKHWFWLKL